MDFRIRLFLLILTGFAAILATTTSEATEPIEGEDVLCVIEDADLGLGLGADVEWIRSGRTDFDSLSRTPLLEMKVSGSPSTDIEVYVEIWAIFGAIRQLVYEDIVTIEAGSEIPISPALPEALTVHPLQQSYVLTLRISVSRLVDGEIVQKKVLEPRFVVYNVARSVYEAVDRRTMEDQYPDGITSERERRDVASRTALSPKDEGVSVSSGPGVYITAPLDDSPAAEDER